VTKQQPAKTGRKEHAATKGRRGSGAASVKTRGERGTARAGDAEESPPLRISGVSTRRSYSRPLTEERSSCLESLGRMPPDESGRLISFTHLLA